MSGIMSVLQELYIRFIVWLGAEPPSGYEHLIRERPSAKKPPKPVPKKPPKVEAPPPKPKPKPLPKPVPTVPEVTEPKEPAPIVQEPDQLEVEEPVTVEEPQQLELEPAQPAVPPPSPPATMSEMVFKYEVQRGDTFNAVARRYGLTVKELLEANDIADADRIYPGQKLIIPGYMLPGPELQVAEEQVTLPGPPVGDQFVYTVASGDTLNAIAKRYGVTVRDLIEANDMKDPQRIRLGQKLIIPIVFKTAKPEYETDPNFPPTGPLDAVRALYMSHFAAGHSEARQKILDLLTSTELNAVVIDAKSNVGWITYPTQTSLAREIGANRPSVENFEEFLTLLKKHHIYTIARIVTFADSALAQSRPELAVKTGSGGLWQDNEKTYWCDPFLQPVWDYNIQLAREAAQLGFAEIQFDMVRFPTKSRAGTPQFSQEPTREKRVAAIDSFLSMAHGQLAPAGVKISTRVHGYTCWRKDDSTIGQDIEQMGEYLDVLCPILAPSTFHAGIPGYKMAVAHPFEVVFESAKRAVERLEGSKCEVRPWIQDFQDYRFDKRPFGKTEIQEQIKACFKAGCSGFMAWNPNARYSADAYAPVTTKS